jgi:hypothetical protein
MSIELPALADYIYHDQLDVVGDLDNHYYDYLLSCDKDVDVYLTYSSMSGKWFGVLSPVKWNIEHGLMEAEIPDDHIAHCVSLIPPENLPDGA